MLIITIALLMGSEPPPPVIVPVARPSITRRVEPSPEPRREAAPADGPMCQAPIPEEYNGPYPTHYGVLVMEPATEAESTEVALQIQSCSRSVKRVADPFMVLAVLRIERDLGLPVGLLGSAWCWEAAMRPMPRKGDQGASHGILQMQGWFFAWCGLPFIDAVTMDIPMAATCYASRIQHYLDDGKCPGNITRAEAMAANGRKYIGWGCKASSLHAAELARWRAPPKPARERAHR